MQPQRFIRWRDLLCLLHGWVGYCLCIDSLNKAMVRYLLGVIK